MPSVLESLGVIKQDTYTAVPQLGISNDLYMRQIESQKYFAIEKGAQAADGNVLAVSIKDGEHFHTSRHDHLEFLNKCTALVKEKSAQLKSVDQKLLASVALSVTATALSFLPFVGILGWVGWGAAVYYINQRATAYTEYQESLKLLVGACNWSLGEGKRQDATDTLTQNESIRNMMTVLYPVLNDAQVKHLIADDIEDNFTKELDAYEKKFTLGFDSNRFFSNPDERIALSKDERIALSKKGAEFNRCIYGFNKGGPTDLLDAILSILPDLYRAAVLGFQQLKYKWQEKNHSPEQTTVDIETSVNMAM